MALGFALMNPFGWLLVAMGRASRSLAIAFLIAPVVTASVFVGVHYGPAGVAACYSCAVCLLVAPVIAWAAHDTGITMRAYFAAIKAPCGAGALAFIAGISINLFAGMPPLLRLALGLVVVFGVYGWVLLILFGQLDTYTDLLRQLMVSRRKSRE